MFELAAENYGQAGPRGYPHVIDTVDAGVVGLEIDPSYALYITTDGNDLVAEMYRRSPRTDNRSGAGYQKYGGQPFADRRPLGVDPTDQELRNLVMELMSYFNMQPGLIHITDD
jgi:hypothetical protein